MFSINNIHVDNSIYPFDLLWKDSQVDKLLKGQIYWSFYIDWDYSPVNEGTISTFR